MHYQFKYTNLVILRYNIRIEVLKDGNIIAKCVLAACISQYNVFKLHFISDFSMIGITVHHANIFPPLFKQSLQITHNI